MHRLFVANKPSQLGSNAFLGRLKRKYGVKKAGFSGTLDPFASGTLIIAFGKYTKLFNYLAKTPKTYEATLWLGKENESLDIERAIQHTHTVPSITIEEVQTVLSHLTGELTYTPPIFSAKRVDGKRAYELARQDKEVKLKEVTSTIHALELVTFNPPFITFKATVSEGTYIRSLGRIIAEKLGTKGILSMLRRVNEGRFTYQNEMALHPLDYLDIPENFYAKSIEDITLGKKIALEDLKFQENGLYLIRSKDNFAIISVESGNVYYRLNQIPLQGSKELSEC